MRQKYLSVGELAQRSGVSIRTLYHYDELKLLRPHHRTPSGHRRYGPDQLDRLEEIRALQGLGLRLDEIRLCLRQGPALLRRALRARRDAARIQLDELQHRLRRLDGLLAHLANYEGADGSGALAWLEAERICQQHLRPTERRALEARSIELAEYRTEHRRRWSETLLELRHLMERGDNPGSDAVQAVQRRIEELVDWMTGGNADLAEALHRVFVSEVRHRERQGIDQELYEFMEAARLHAA